MKLLSSAAYHSLRTSGFIELPLERTLRDYTHYFKSTTGFQDEVDEMLKKEVKGGSWTKYVVLLLDEMKLKEGLVYDKYSCKVVELDEVDNQLRVLDTY